MLGLQLDTFLRAGTDLERAQYEILGGLQEVRRAFQKTAIYPYLGELIGLYRTLSTITDQLSTMRGSVPGRITGVDLKAGRVVYDKQDMPQDDVAALEELIHWALPHLQASIEEGKTIFEFVDDNLEMEEVGLIPTYLHEGYLLVPDGTRECWAILRYSVSVFSGPEDQYRSLRTHVVKTLPMEALSLEARQVKLDLVREKPDLPNPATYHFVTDLELPFASTTLPVAKRKLMRYLASNMGQA